MAFKWVYSIFGGVGLLLLCVGMGLVWWQFQIEKNYLEAEGVVLENVWRSARNEVGSLQVAYPVITFRDSKGQDVTFTASFGSRPPAHRKGERVRVRYNPENTQEALLDYFWVKWMAPLIVLGIGLVFSVIGGGLFWAISTGRLTVEE